MVRHISKIIVTSLEIEREKESKRLSGQQNIVSFIFICDRKKNSSRPRRLLSISHCLALSHDMDISCCSGALEIVYVAFEDRQRGRVVRFCW